MDFGICLCLENTKILPFVTKLGNERRNMISIC